ncbi:acyltransferase [Pseudonocardia sp.]|uniref:acyltransferase n=1 Tax=Pseudonocardia sp. TaxID=60912 RepID=UPI002614B455|nr:acyltransferase [Pseudonocardia sp.]MCW2717188.1 acyltransferase 3 [Pseudonocardia sp.]
MAARSSHVYPADMVRVLTFACVIAVHTVSTVNPLDSVPFGALTMLLHFTREAFFVLTAFVLMHRYRDRGPQPLPFWRRRFLLVGVPYVVWSVIYTGLQLVTAPQPPDAAAWFLLDNLLTGRAWFHLYFLLVSMQFYLLFPVFRWLLRATRRHHGWLIAASLVLQVLTDIWLHDPAPVGFKAAVLPYAGSIFLSYQFFLVLGGVVAMHLDEVDAWVRGRVGVVVGAFVVTGAAAEAWYLWTVPDVGAIFGTDVFQWVMIPWVVAVVAVFWAIGAAWSDRRDGGPGSRFLDRASDRSFGVFLVHPVILWALTIGGPGSTAAMLPVPWSSVVTYVIAVVGSLAILEVLRLTPLSVALTGKSRSRRSPQQAHSLDTGPTPPTSATVGTDRTRGDEMTEMRR